MDDFTTKLCRKCGAPKPLSSYTADTRYKDGYYPWCAECRRAWRQARKDRTRELNRKWVNEHHEHVLEQARIAYHERYKEKITPKRRARDRQRWHTDPVHRAKKNRWRVERYHSDPEYNRKRKLLSLAHVHKRRAIVRALTSHFTPAEWRALCDKYDNQCLKCGEQKPLTPDHVVPLSRDGSNDISNIQPLCLSCNLHKGDKIADYRPSMDGG